MRDRLTVRASRIKSNDSQGVMNRNGVIMEKMAVE
jgi:hypothetical protein